MGDRERSSVAWLPVVVEWGLPVFAPGGCRGSRAVAVSWVRAEPSGWSGVAPGLAASSPPGRCGSLSRVSWPGSRARVSRSPARLRGDRSCRGDAVSVGAASAPRPSGWCRRDRSPPRTGQRSPSSGSAGHGISSRDASDHPPEPAAELPARRPPPDPLPSLRPSRVEVEVLDYDRPRPVYPRGGDQATDGGPERPSRTAAGSPARSRTTVRGAPRAFPSGVMTATARWPAFTSTATTECARRASRDGAGATGNVQLASFSSSQPSSGCQRIVSLPHGFAASPSAVRKIREASHRACHCCSVSPAAVRFARARSRRRPPRSPAPGRRLCRRPPGQGVPAGPSAGSS